MIKTFRALTALTVIMAQTAGATWGTVLPLDQVQVPEPPNLSQFVNDRAAAIRLGKAFFWDMQAGSDGVTACASCHYRAGADPFSVRAKNQLNPGPDSVFQVKVPGPNSTLTASDFPFFQIVPGVGRVGIDTIFDLIFNPTPAIITRNFNDVTGSQGVHRTDFVSIIPGSAVDNGTPVPDPVFSAGGVNTRQVTGRNAPSVINAVFNYTNSWDGRANNIFNGENAFGPADPNAGVWFNVNNAPAKQPVAIPNGSLASQAVEAALSDVMMSFKGRTFPELGRKILNLPPPLNLQLVHPNDSVLGSLSRATLNPDGTVSGNTGIDGNYTQMIQAAFQDNLWNLGGQPITINIRGVDVPFSQMEANFALFWGLAIQLYESTLVSDRTPFDRFQAGNQNALSSVAQLGLQTFTNRCAVCHSGSELTSAVVGNNAPICIFPDCNPLAFTGNANHRLIPATNQTNALGALSDLGFFNTGVRATSDDIGRGGNSPFTNPLTSQPIPLSFSKLAELQAQGQLPFVTPQLPPLVPATQPVAVDGSFKTPGLRNIELTAPYMHNGGMLTLDQVVEFYTRGGNFPDNPHLALAVQPIGNLRGDPLRRAQVAAFLNSLTDDRVRNEWAPFDHPELRIPNGDPEDVNTIITIAAKGGIPIVVPGLIFNPVTTPTIVASQVIGGTVSPAVQNTVVVSVSVNGQSPAPATLTGNTWSFTVTGLILGNNTISVTATDVTGGEESANQVIRLLPAALIFGAPLVASNQTGATLTIGGNGVESYQFSLDGGALSADIPVATPIVLSGLSEGIHTVSVLGKGRDAAGNLLSQPPTTPTIASWTVKSIPPVLTLNPISSPIRSSLTIGGTVELGLVPVITVATGATAAPVRVIGGAGIAAWSCDISGLNKGINNITVTATDIAFNVTSRAAAVRVILSDGDFNNKGRTDIFDALKALHMAVGLVQPSTEDILHGDVAPLVNGIPAPDGAITVDDALAILKKVVGLVKF